MRMGTTRWNPDLRSLRTSANHRSVREDMSLCLLNCWCSEEDGREQYQVAA